MILGTVLPGCRVSHPVSYDDPLDSVLTYQTAFAKGDPVAEYRCLAASVKQQADLQGYATLRERLLTPLGFWGRLFLKHNSLHNNLRATYRLSEGSWNSKSRNAPWGLVFSLFGNEFRVDVERNSILTLQCRQGGPSEVAVPRAPRDSMESSSTARVRLDLPTTFVQAMERHGLQQVVLEGQWKIAGMMPGGVSSEERYEALPLMDSIREHTINVTSLAWEVVSEDLGSAEVELTLPSSASLMVHDGTWMPEPGVRCWYQLGPVSP